MPLNFNDIPLFIGKRKKIHAQEYDVLKSLIIIR